MASRIRIFSMVPGFALALLLPSVATAQAAYQVAEIPNVAGITYAPTAMSINNAGQVVGYYEWVSVGGRGGSRTNYLGWQYENGGVSQIGSTMFRPVKI